MIDVKPQRGAISQSAFGCFAPLGLTSRLAFDTQGCALGYRISPRWGCQPGICHNHLSPSLPRLRVGDIDIHVHHEQS